MKPKEIDKIEFKIMEALNGIRTEDAIKILSNIHELIGATSWVDYKRAK